MSEIAQRLVAAEALTIEGFLSFAAGRSERWLLLDGEAFCVTPPSFTHQRIAQNLERILNAGLEVSGRGLFALRDAGVYNPGDSGTLLQPDVAVLRDRATDEPYDDAYLLAAEIVSDSNTPAMIAKNVRFYKANAANLGVLIVQRRAVSVTLFARDSDWEPMTFNGARARIERPGLGVWFTLGDLYRGTPLSSSP